MKLKEGFDEFDFQGVLFVRFPVDLSWRESRERMELMILEASDYYEPEDTRDYEIWQEPEISPYWIWLALANEQRLATNKMTAKERRLLANQILANRRNEKNKKN